MPQGSVLGPLLFLIMMLDIDAKIEHSELGSFADDTKLWYIIKSINEEVELQQDLNTLFDWAADNNFDYNEKKFERVAHGRSSIETSYKTASGAEIKQKDTVRDLGVHFSYTTNFAEHIKRIVAAGKKLSGYILRTFRTRGTHAMLTLLKSILVTTLEYACIVWSPTVKSLVKMLEGVQRRFTSRFSCFNSYDEKLGRMKCKVPYWDRIKELRIFSLERRRERYMILYLYKIFIGLCPNPGFKRFLFNERTGWKVDVKQNLRAEKWVQNLRNSSFFSLAPTLFNALPLELRTFILPETPTKEDVDKYKEELDKYLWCVPDEPGIIKERGRSAESNSLIHQMRFYQGQNRKRARENDDKEKKGRQEGKKRRRRGEP